MASPYLSRNNTHILKQVPSEAHSWWRDFHRVHGVHSRGPSTPRLWGCRGHPTRVPERTTIEWSPKGKQVLEVRQSRMPEGPAKSRLAAAREMGWVAEDEVGGDSLFMASRTEPRRVTFLKKALGSC